jgi:hypothetical protein
MSLLQVCHDVADVVGVTRPLSIVSSTDQLARQMLGLAQETLEELSLMDWPILAFSHTVPTVVGQAQYDLPADFEHEIGDTLYAKNRYEQLRGSLTPGDWARNRNALPDLGRLRFRIFGLPSKINVMPTPTLVEDLVFEYKTRLRVHRIEDNSLGFNYGVDTDVSIVPEELVKKGLKWRLRRAKGLDYSEEFDDYEFSRTSRLAQQLQFGSMPVAYRSPFDSDAFLTNGYVPESGFGP